MQNQHGNTFNAKFAIHGIKIVVLKRCTHFSFRTQKWGWEWPSAGTHLHVCLQPHQWGIRFHWKAYERLILGPYEYDCGVQNRGCLMWKQSWTLYHYLLLFPSCSIRWFDLLLRFFIALPQFRYLTFTFLFINSLIGIWILVLETSQKFCFSYYLILYRRVW